MRAYTLLLLLLLISGCAQLKGSIPPDTAVFGKAPGSLRALAVVELEKMGFRGRAVILVKSPDLLRIDLLGPFGQVVAVIIGDGGRLAYYSKAESRAYSFEDTLLGYSLRPRELVSFLTGRPGENGHYEYDLDEEGNITGLVKLNDGVPVLKVAMEDYRSVRGVPIPFAITIDDGTERLNISYSSVELDPELSGELFILPGD